MTQIRALFLEYLADQHSGTYDQAAHGVAKLGIDRGIFTPKEEAFGRDYSYCLEHRESVMLREAVRQEMWLLLGQGLLVFGLNDANPNWPNYTLTDTGKDVVKGLGPQPYDPDGYLAEFHRINPNVDPVISEYVEEAIRSFNHGCPIAATVMVGCASEKAMLLLLESFESAISDPKKRSVFVKKCGWTIYSKYDALKTRLDLMTSAGKFQHPLNEYVSSNVPGAFDLIRRQRNAAGHPAISTSARSETVFLSLRIFAEYVQSIYELIEFFSNNDADW